MRCIFKFVGPDPAWRCVRQAIALPAYAAALGYLSEALGLATVLLIVAGLVLATIFVIAALLMQVDNYGLRSE